MSKQELEMTEHLNKEYSSPLASDPKNVQELTNFVQLTLTQMQDKFQSMSDQIISRNILFVFQELIFKFIYFALVYFWVGSVLEKK